MTTLRWTALTTMLWLCACSTPGGQPIPLLSVGDSGQGLDLSSDGAGDASRPDAAKPDVPAPSDAGPDSENLGDADGDVTTSSDRGGFIDVPAPEDVWPNDDGSPGDANLTDAPTAGVKPIMAPCTQHAECASGYCYDEAFNGGGFCSIDCDTGQPCAGLEHPDFPGKQKYGCAVLDALADDYGLTVKHLCVLRCDDVAECQAYSTRYDQCGNFAQGEWTSWDGHTVGFGTCVDSSEVAP